MLQRERDRAQGQYRRFHIGYRGSPLGMYDHALWRAKPSSSSTTSNSHLASTRSGGHRRVQPAGRDVPAQGRWRSHLVRQEGESTARSMRSRQLGGHLAERRRDCGLVGDDHGCQSSTLAHQSEQVLRRRTDAGGQSRHAAGLSRSRHLGFALSRYSGCWVGFKAISETVESSASIVSDPDRIKIVLPTDFEMPSGGLSIRWPDAPMEQERRLHGPKMQAVAAFARVNRFDRIVLGSKPARLGIWHRQGLSRPPAGAGRPRHIRCRGAGAGLRTGWSR
jgi:indolepyruvate ferredoxin oxidoreductase